MTITHRPAPNGTVRIDGIIKKETDKAVLISRTIDETEPDKQIEQWFPLSQIYQISRNPATGDYLLVSPWIAKKKDEELEDHF